MALAERLQHAKAIYLYAVDPRMYLRLVEKVVADGERLSYLLLAGGLAGC